MSTAIVWFRRDLRLADHPALSAAAQAHEHILPLYIHAPHEDGAWTPGAPLLSQTFIVSPNTSYRLSFAVKTKDLVTGGPPLIVVNDAANDQLLAKSENFPTATTPWTRLNLDFTTPPAAQAAVIRLQRNNCDSSPCPIFGTLWLDEFSVEQTKLTSKR